MRVENERGGLGFFFLGGGGGGRTQPKPGNVLTRCEFRGSGKENSMSLETLSE